MPPREQVIYEAALSAHTLEGFIGEQLQVPGGTIRLVPENRQRPERIGPLCFAPALMAELLLEAESPGVRLRLPRVVVVQLPLQL